MYLKTFYLYFNKIFNFFLSNKLKLKNWNYDRCLFIKFLNQIVKFNYNWKYFFQVKNLSKHYF